MINITKIKCIANSYPEEIEGTNEWYFCREEGDPCNDLYDAHEIFNRDGLFKGIIHHLVHYPDGKVHSPFQIQENVYVEKPIWNNGEFNFLAVYFQEKIIRITKYIPENEKLEIVTELSLAEVEDCYNLMLETTPLTLGRSGNDGFYEIVWPEKRRLQLEKQRRYYFVMKISYIYQNGMKIQNIMKM